MPDEKFLGQSIIDNSTVDFDTLLLFQIASYTVNDVGAIELDDILENTDDWTGSTDPITPATSFVGLPGCQPEIVGTLRTRLSDVAGFLLVAEVEFTDTTGFGSFRLAASDDFNEDQLYLFQLNNGTGMTLKMPSAQVIDSFMTNRRQRIAYLWTPTYCGASVNGCAPLTVASEAFDKALWALRLDEATSFLKFLAVAAPVDPGRLSFISKC